MALGQQHDLSGLIENFSENDRALRIFADRIGRHADAYDREAASNLVATLREVLPGHFFAAREVPEEHSALPSSRLPDGRKAGDQGGSHDTEAALPAEISAEKQAALRAEMQKPEVVEAIVGAVSSFRKQAPNQGRLLRQSALVSLMSAFESLVADLAHAYFARFPNALSADQRSLTLAQLRELGSVDDAVAYLVGGEIDALLRESLDRQIAYFSKPLGVDTRPLDALLPRLVEVDQRRNLLVHSKGVVNKYYLRRVDPGLAGEFSAEGGKELQISEEYLNYALDHALVCGVILGMQSWSKWAKREHEERDSMLVNLAFEALQQRRYRVVCALATYAVAGVVQSDSSRRMLTINHACALSVQDDANGMERVLESLDWSAAALRFRLALSSLRGDEAEFFRLLPRCVAAEEVTRSELEEWPVYAGARQFDQFTVTVDRLAPVNAALTEGAKHASETGTSISSGEGV